jgi:diguanylate cyclase (GGDEF)-like protein
MFDLDHFKSINDNLGHIVGDKCLKSLSYMVRKHIRDFDLFGRYGGDEFIIVNPNTNLKHSRIIAERLRQEVERTENPHYTLSIGISTYPEDGRTVKELILSADKALYISKDKGRNAVSHKDLF